VDGDVVAVAGQLVAGRAGLGLHDDAADLGQEAGQSPEQRRVEHQLLLQRHRAGHLPPQRRRVGVVVGAAELDGGVEALQQPQIPHVAQEHPATRHQTAHRAAQHLHQVVDTREVLGDRVDHHDVERAER
jgi:hypothetical protein